MTTELAASLAVLALIDSTSFGTLLIPIWLMLAPGRVRTARILLFLATVAGFYLVVGIALVSGLATVLTDTDALLANPAVTRAQLVVGIGLFVWSFFIGRKPAREHEPARAEMVLGPDAGAGSAREPCHGSAGVTELPASAGRLLRWRQRAVADAGGRSVGGGVLALALGAAVVEVATMLPYLAATGLIASKHLAIGQQVAVLAGYCLVMIAPALVLLALRVGARRRVEPALQRTAAWMERTGAETTAWVVGIVGFLIASDALGRLPGVAGFLS